MYTISDAVELGNARELILTDIKEVLQRDDNEFFTLPSEEYFDE